VIGDAGDSLVEVLVALVLVAITGGALAAVTATSGRALVAARRDATGVSFAVGRLETLRAGPRTHGADGAPLDGVDFARTWTVVPGRGRPDALAVDVRWPGHAIALGTAVLP
jgi:Tfp pilus assembly protein PilV